MRTTQQVIEHHLQAFGEGLESVLSDYDENSCVINPDGNFRGMTEIKTLFTAFISSLPDGFLEAFKVTKMEVDGEIGFITWEANPWFPHGTDTFVVKNGKIKYQTFAAYSPA